MVKKRRRWTQKFILHAMSRAKFIHVKTESIFAVPRIQYGVVLFTMEPRAACMHLSFSRHRVLRAILV